MFGFGKNSLNEQMMESIGVQVAMFVRWALKKRYQEISLSEIDFIIERVLDRGNLKYSNDQKIKIASFVLYANSKIIDEMIIQTRFDSNVESFCRSIAIKVPEYNTPD